MTSKKKLLNGWEVTQNRDLQLDGNMAQTKKLPTITKTAKSVLDTLRKHTAGTFKVAGVASSLFLASESVFGLGLGVLDVQSNLDQPLDGYITVNIAPGDDINTLTAQVATREEFETFGIDYPEYLKDFKLDVSRNDQGAILRVGSDGIVIKEPFIHFLVKVNWSGGNFLREYTALIDPPVYAAETPKAISQPRSVGTDQSYSSSVDDFNYNSNQTDTNTASQSSYNSVEPDTSPSTHSSSNDARYGPVAAGESLSLIALELQRQVPDLSIYSIMKILHEDNFSAFIGGNINGLIKGSILNIRDIDEIRAVDTDQARVFFQEQLQDWDPSVLTAQNTESNVRVGQDSYGSDSELYGSASNYSESESGNDNFQVGRSESDTFVSASQGESNDGEVLALRQEISQLQTSLASSDLENQELTERISSLEGQLADMNRLMSLSVENADLASLEATLAKQNDAAEALELSDEGNSIDDFLNDSIEFESLQAANTDDLLSEFIDDTSDGVESIESATDGSVSEKVAEVEVPNVEVPNVEVPKVVAKPKIKAPESTESLLDKIGGIAPIAGGLGALLVAGAGLFFMRRRRADEEFEISMLSIESNSQSIGIVDTASGQSKSGHMTATVADSMSASETQDSMASADKETSFLTVYSDSDAVVQADEVDPIAEADVYIAYGRDEQAEEVLLDGIVANPDRVDVKQKLIGLYFKNKNKEGFERIAEELYAQRDNISGSDWQEINDMGKELAPENPLFELSGVDFDVAEQHSENIDDDTLNEIQADVPAGLTVDVQEVAQETEEEALVFDTVDETEEQAAIELGKEAKEALGSSDEMSDLIVSSLEEDTSLDLINFDEDGSPISELDEIDIGSLDIKDDEASLIEFDLEESIDIDQDDEEVELAIDFGDDELAVEELTEGDLVIDFDAPDNTLSLDVDDTEQSSLTLNDVDDSEKSFGDVAEVSDLIIDPDYNEAQTQYELAKVFVDLGDEEGAKQILDDLVANSDNSDEIIKNSQELLNSINA